MKILIYTHEFIPHKGGVATYNYELARGLTELGQEVVVLAPRYSDKDIILDENLPFKIIRAKLPKRSIMESAWSFLHLPVGVWHFIKVQKQHRPDYVLVTNVVAHEYAAAARLFFTFRFALTIHGSEIYMHSLGKMINQWLKVPLMQWFFHKANKIICVSYSTQNLLNQKMSNLRDKTSVVYCGIDLNEFSTNKNYKELLRQFNLANQKVILTVARLSSGKGQDVVIQALPKLLKEIPNVKYLIVGDGRRRQELEKLVEKRGLKEAVIFAGAVDHNQLYDFYNVCNIFVMLSRRGKKESFGIVFLEAWAHEKPVIGGNIGGVDEVIDNGETGLLVDPNDVDAAAEAICQLLENEDLAVAMGKAGRKKAEKVFSRKAMAQKTLTLLQD